MKYKNWGNIKEIDYCKKSNKVMFDKRGAQSAKNKRWEDEHVELRIYPCPDCNHWHLTSSLRERKDDFN